MTQRPLRVLEQFPLLQDPPFTLDGTRALLLALPADRVALQRLCLRTFGWAAPQIIVEPAASAVLCVVTAASAARASDPMLGSFAYQEITFFVPVKGTRNGVPFFAMHVPFIYPDAAMAIVAGREIYGLPKKPATITFPDDAAIAAGALIEARALCAERFDGSAWQERSLVRIHSQPQGLVPAIADVVLDAIDALLGPLALPPRLLRSPLLSLKQPADVTTGGHPPRVLSRQVVKLAAPVRALSNVRLADASQFRVEVEDWASEPIRSVLGLDAVVTPSLAVSLTMDFSFDAGEVWLEQPTPPAAPSTKKKVLVLGGGMAGLSAAHALTDTLARRNQYEVRVLSEGHFLGGKGGNVRNPARGERIEEHGLHVIFGFYHNFLRLFRSVFTEANRPLGVWPRTFDEAFRPREHIVFHDGEHHWEMKFPETPATHGAGPSTVEEMLSAASSLFGSVASATLGAFGRLLGGGVNPVQTEVLKFVWVLVNAVTEDIVVRRKSWDELDAEDFRAWMMRHAPLFGFDDIEDSAIMQVPYDGIFAYEGGDQSRPVLGAGTAARLLLKLVTDYERAPYHIMTAGMGEAVVMPLYEVLKARGVAIETFTRVKEIRMVGGRVAQVVIARQATVLAGPAAYDPVIVVDGVRCWRHLPDPAQLDPASPALTEDPFSDASSGQVGPDIVLEDGVDFDWVVCGLPAPVTAHVLRGHGGNRLLTDIARIPTVATLHLQLWTKRSLPMLGWGFQSPVVGGFRQPLNSMLDSAHVLSRETWAGPDVPRGLLYLSGPFGGGWATDSADPAARVAAEAAAKAEASTFVRHELHRVLPNARVGGQFDLGELFAPSAPATPMDDQYVRGNVDRSSRYLLMKPGTLKLRPRPDDASLTNLRFVGDWTRTGIDIPCMEGTVTSALMAAASITGEDLDVLW